MQVYGSASGANEIAIRGEQLIVEASFACHTSRNQVRFYIELVDLAMGMTLTSADCEVPEVMADGTLRCTFFNLPLKPSRYAVMLKIMHADTALDIWRYAALITARRISPTPSNKVKKYPHEIMVDVGGTPYHHSYESPKTAEASVRIP